MGKKTAHYYYVIPMIVYLIFIISKPILQKKIGERSINITQKVLEIFLIMLYTSFNYKFGLAFLCIVIGIHLLPKQSFFSFEKMTLLDELHEEESKNDETCDEQM